MLARPDPELAMALHPLHYGPRKHVAAQRKRLEALRFESIETRPLSPCLGAEVSGLDLREPLAPSVVKEVDS